MPSVQLDPRFPVIPVRALANAGTAAFPRGAARACIDRFTRGELSQKEAQLEIEHFWAGALRRAVIDGDVEAGSLMAGQSVGMVTREQSDRARSSTSWSSRRSPRSRRGTSDADDADPRRETAIA